LQHFFAKQGLILEKYCMDDKIEKVQRELDKLEKELSEQIDFSVYFSQQQVNYKGGDIGKTLEQLIRGRLDAHISREFDSLFPPSIEYFANSVVEQDF
jgi:hypothetical protein